MQSSTHEAFRFNKPMFEQIKGRDTELKKNWQPKLLGILIFYYLNTNVVEKCVILDHFATNFVPKSFNLFCPKFEICLCSKLFQMFSVLGTWPRGMVSLCTTRSYSSSKITSALNLQQFHWNFEKTIEIVLVLMVSSEISLITQPSHKQFPWFQVYVLINNNLDLKRFR